MLTVPNRYSYKYDYVEQHSKDIKVLLLGNCHIEDALNPKILGDSVFNTAISGREIIYDEELAKHFIPKMQNLKTVIMQFDYRSFGLGREKRNPRDYKEHGGFESTFKCMYTKYMKFSVDGWWYWSEIINSELNYKSRIWMDPKDAIECDSLGFVQLPDEVPYLGINAESVIRITEKQYIDRFRDRCGNRKCLDSDRLCNSFRQPLRVSCLCIVTYCNIHKLRSSHQACVPPGYHTGCCNVLMP